MFLTEEDFWFLVRNGAWLLTLALCLVLLLFPAFRRRANPFAWLVWANLAAGALWYAQYPLASARQTLFKSANPGYAAAAQSFMGRSVHIPDPRAMRQAAYSCYLTYSTTLCEMPVARMLKTGQLDFVEIGSDPIERYTLEIHDPACLDWDDPQPRSHFDHDFILTDRFLSPGMGACVIAQEVDTVTATHAITATRETASATPHWSVTLRDRETGTVIDQFDGWRGATPYLSFDPPTEARRPLGPLADLLMIRPDEDRYNRAVDDQLIADYGIDEDLILAAISSPYQTYIAQTLWLTCRDGVVATLSPDTRAALTDASRGLFGADSSWVYPESCADWAR